MFITYCLLKFYRDGKYETASGNNRVKARIRKRQSDLTASRGELIEVNVESAFEPIIRVILFQSAYIKAVSD